MLPKLCFSCLYFTWKWNYAVIVFNFLFLLHNIITIFYPFCTKSLNSSNSRIIYYWAFQRKTLYSNIWLGFLEDSMFVLLGTMLLGIFICSYIFKLIFSYGSYKIRWIVKVITKKKPKQRKIAISTRSEKPAPDIWGKYLRRVPLFIQQVFTEHNLLVRSVLRIGNKVSNKTEEFPNLQTCIIMEFHN